MMCAATIGQYIALSGMGIVMLALFFLLLCVIYWSIKDEFFND